MDVFIFIFGPFILGGVWGVVAGIKFRRNSKQNHHAALIELAHILQNSDWGAEDVIKVFETNGHRLKNKSEGALVFQPIPLRDWSMAEIIGWSIVLMGSIASFLAVFHFIGRPHERVEVDLVALRNLN